MEQPQLFVTDIYDALGDVVRALGGPKKVGTKLRPEKEADEAATWVKDCLNRKRRERFDPEQVLWLLREARLAGYHGAMNYICAFASYDDPVPTSPETEAAKARRQITEATQLLKASLDRLERAESLPAPLQAVK
jgi:hypothetical protein